MADERKAVIEQSTLKGKYDQAIDPESASEVLAARVAQAAKEAEAADEEAPSGGGGLFGAIFGTSRNRGERLTSGQLVARSVTRSVTGRVAGQIGKPIFGDKFGGMIGRGTLGSILRR